MNNFADKAATSRLSFSFSVLFVSNVLEFGLRQGSSCNRCLGIGEVGIEIIVTPESEFLVFRNVRNMVNRYTCKWNGKFSLTLLTLIRKMQIAKTEKLLSPEVSEFRTIIR